jgi:hypothetical protein
MVIPKEDEIANTAADRGVPLVIGYGRQPISMALVKLANFVSKELGSERSSVDAKDAEPEEKSGSIFGKLLGRRVNVGG